VDYTVDRGFQEVYTVVNNQDKPAARGKVVSARVDQHLYDEVKASGVGTADLLKIALGKVKPDPTPANVSESIDSDPDILAKEKELHLAKLDREIAEARAPGKLAARIAVFESRLLDLEQSSATMVTVVNLLGKPDSRVEALQRQVQYLNRIVNSAIPQRLDELARHLGRN
jgi:hypothetical protein